MTICFATLMLSAALTGAPQDKKLDTLPEIVDSKNLVFSPAGGAVAYRLPIETEEENKFAVVINGKKGEVFDGVEDLTFSPGGVCAYVAKRGEKSLVVFGDQKYGPYDDVSERVFSPDGKRVAFWAESGEKRFVVVDGKPQKITLTPEEAVAIGFLQLKPVFSPDSKRVAYAAVRGQKMFLVVDDQAGSEMYDGVKNPAFSADGQAIAFPAKKDGKWRVVVGGKEGEGYEEIYWLTFGKVPAIVASPGGTSLVVVGEQKMEKFSPAGPAVASPTAAIAAYWADLKDGGHAVVVGEEAGEGFGLMSPIGVTLGHERPVFLADGKTVVYRVVLASGQSHVVIGKQKSDPYGLVDDLVVSPDGKSVAYVAAKGDKYFVIAAGKKSAEFERAARPVFLADGKVGFYIVKGDEIWWKTME